MKIKIVLITAILLFQAQLAWSIEKNYLSNECVSKSELVERMKQHLADSAKFDLSDDSSLVDRAAKTRLGVSLQQRVHKMEEGQFNAWLKFQESCELKEFAVQQLVVNKALFG